MLVLGGVNLQVCVMYLCLNGDQSFSYINFKLIKVIKICSWYMDNV